MASRHVVPGDASMPTCLSSQSMDGLPAKAKADGAPTPPTLTLFTSGNQLASVAVTVAVGTLVSHLLLISLVYTYAPAESFRQLKTIECIATALTAAILWTASFYRIAGECIAPDSRTRGTSTVILAVHLVAAISNTAMYFGPAPVVIDYVVGTEQHLFRWAEYGVLACTMTFLVEAIDASSLLEPTLRALQMGAVVLGCGFVLPFVRDARVWGCLLACGLGATASIYPRTWARVRDMRDRPLGALNACELERHVRMVIARDLLVTCSVMWSLFALSYGLAAFSHRPGQPHAEWPFVVDCVVDVTVKMLYAEMIHRANAWVPAQFDKAQAQLLSESTAVMWQHSSDALIIVRVSDDVLRFKAGKAGAASPDADAAGASAVGRDENDRPGSWHGPRGSERARAPQHLNTIASASVVQILGEPSCASWHTWTEHSCDAGAFEKGRRAAGERVERQRAQQLHSPRRAAAAPPLRAETASAQPPIELDADAPTALDDSEAEAQRVAVRARATSLASVIAYALGAALAAESGVAVFSWQVTRRRDDGGDGGGEQLDSTPGEPERICEIRASLADDCRFLVMVLRDETDRARLHATQQALARSVATREQMLRLKDEEVNSFTRHEVKNGVLGAMALCDTILEQLQHATPAAAAAQTVVALHAYLQTTLNTVLIEAMARELIHGTYCAQPERVRVDELLRSAADFNGSRFTLSVSPDPLPALLLDPKLLQHIHRNAISNASKYGGRLGAIHTEVEYAAGTLRMRVHNLPGDDHAALLALADPSIVFAKGVRLASAASQPTGANGAGGISTSTGDGGWIMQKCCDALGGSCSIVFEPERTVFELVCAAAEPPAAERGAALDFVLPAGSWAIGFDDSALQRKILGKMFELVGVPVERTIVLGGTDDEILRFAELAADAITRAATRVLVVVDENLELGNGSVGQTVSGSLELVKLQQMLPAAICANTLLVVRSANDSKKDCETYLSRAHAVIAKTGLNKQAMCEQLEALWAARFPSAAVMG